MWISPWQIFLKSSMRDNHVCYWLHHPQTLPVTSVYITCPCPPMSPDRTGVSISSYGKREPFPWFVWNDLKTLSGPIRRYVVVALGGRRAPKTWRWGGHRGAGAKGRENGSSRPERAHSTPQDRPMPSQLSIPVPTPGDTWLSAQSHSLPPRSVNPGDVQYCICWLQ